MANDDAGLLLSANCHRALLLARDLQNNNTTDENEQQKKIGNIAEMHSKLPVASELFAVVVVCEVVLAEAVDAEFVFAAVVADVVVV